MENATEQRSNLGARVKQAVTPNKSLFPLKLAIFFYCASAFCILPYLTIHMKDIGISIEHIALIYAILPFNSLVSSPLVGFLADKLGNYTRVLIVTLLGDAVFYSLLLAVPKVATLDYWPENGTLEATGSGSWLTFPSANVCQDCQTLEISAVSELLLTKCNWTCESLRPFVNPCNVFAAPTDFCNVANETLLISNVTVTEASCDGGVSRYGISLGAATINDGCELMCNMKAAPEFLKCQIEEGSRLLTNILYFIFRAIANMFLSCNFVLIDAQTIQMCKAEEQQGRSGAIGRNYVFGAVAQAVISPCVGKLMDVVAKSTESGDPNYLVPFIGNVIFILLTVVMVCFIKLDIDLPKSASLKKIKTIFVNPDISMFLFMMFVLGNFWGFIETFLFVYLKDDMGAPMYLLGLTITVGALVSIPFLYSADWIIEKVGRVNVFIIALFIYAARYIGYSLISNPWYSFPFEALEVFTNTLMRVAAIQYVGMVAPNGMVATLNGMAGGLHYGFGKGTGSLMGGAIIAAIGSTAQAFRYFGYAAVFFGSVYFLYDYVIARLCWRSRDKSSKNNDVELEAREEENFLEKVENQEPATN